MTQSQYTHISLLIDSSGSMSIIRDATIANYNKFIAEQKKLPGKATLSHYEFSSGSKFQNKNARPTRYLVDYLSAKYTAPNWVVLPAAPVGQISCPSNSNISVGANNCIPNWSPPFGPITIPSTFGSPLPLTTNEFSIVEDFVDLQKARDLNQELYVPYNFTPLLDSIGRAIYETGEKLASLPAAERPERVLFVIITDGQENASQEYTKEDIKAVIEHQQTKYNWDFIFLGANMDAVSVGTSYGINAGMSVNFAATDASIGGSTQTLSEKVASYRTTEDFYMAKSSLNYSASDRSASMGVPTTNTDSKIVVSN